MVGYSDLVEGGVLVYPGRNKSIITRKQVVVIESKVARMLPSYSDASSDDPEETAADEPTSPRRKPGGKGDPPTTSTGHRHGHSTRGATGVGSRAGAVEEACMQACLCCCAGGEGSEVDCSGDHEHKADESALASSQVEGDAILALPKNPHSITQALRGP
ncbi:hypothetical protein B484DRAFT_402530 [Ochromonadaceae sp. CCMP2298]|nr:hypothetical protein B484DRAFT_402530 [Ochromonadaceae sp. CCMP2298]